MCTLGVTIYSLVGETLSLSSSWNRYSKDTATEETFKWGHTLSGAGTARDFEGFRSPSSYLRRTDSDFIHTKAANHHFFSLQRNLYLLIPYLYTKEKDGHGAYSCRLAHVPAHHICDVERHRWPGPQGLAPRVAPAVSVTTVGSGDRHGRAMLTMPSIARQAQNIASVTRIKRCPASWDKALPGKFASG